LLTTRPSPPSCWPWPTRPITASDMRSPRVSRAVVAIGFQEVRHICLGLIPGWIFCIPPHSATQQMAKAFVAARTGGERVHQNHRRAKRHAKADIGFTAGLLHDIGKVILAALLSGYRGTRGQAWLLRSICPLRRRNRRVRLPTTRWATCPGRTLGPSAHAHGGDQLSP
jgi:hypothetical protein